MKSIFKILALCLPVLVLTACGDDDDDHDHAHPEINIISPSNGDMISADDASSVEIHVEVSSENEVHEMEVHLVVEGTDEEVLHHEGHSHKQMVEFKQMVDLSSYDSGTSFKLEVEVCVDHDCEEIEDEEITFSIQ